MLQYTLKRILLFIPTLIGVSILIFLLGSFSPYDPCPSDLSGRTIDAYSCQLEIKKLHLDKPNFYFKISTQAYPDTMYLITNKNHRKTLNRLIDQYGNWEAIEKYYHSIVEIDKRIERMSKGQYNDLFTTLNKKFPPLLFKYNDEEIRHNFKVVKEAFGDSSQYTGLLEAIQKAEKNYENVKSTATPNKKYLPAIHFYGFDNQYHIWASSFLRGDFGKSYINGESVVVMIKQKLPITVLLSSISIILAYIIAIQLGVRSAARKGSTFDSTVNTGLFMLYSIPNFWVGMMMMVFLVRPEFLELFPAGDLYDENIQKQGTFIQKVLDYIHHLILPVICWTYPSLAFLARQMRGGMLTVMSEDYIRTAKAKGLPPKRVIWKHGYKNALLPIATMLGNVFPKLIAGSIVLEYIFDLKGMGLLFFQAIGQHNNPVVLTIVMFIAILTMIGYLISDILYAIIDPRIKLGTKR